MKKQVKTFAALALVCICAIGTVGCGEKETTAKTELSVWSTYNTEKVIQQSKRNDTYEKMPAEISVQMMQGEYEGAQLIITANKDMTYTLTAGELKSENGDVIPAENVAIYHQKYMTIKSNYNGNPDFSAGDAIPDMLLPMDTAVKYEENTIAEGNNQGITVEINSEGVNPGVYTGTFTLELDGEKTEIPATVEVWDIAYDERRTFQSSFLIYRSQLLAGEYDSSDEMINSYIDVLMDYKVNAYVIRNDNTVERFIEDSVRLFEDNNCNSLIIPYDFPLSYTTYEGEMVSVQAETVLAYIKELAKISTEEKPYIEYAYFYPSTYDEADVVEERIEPSWNFLKKGGELDQTLELAVKQLKDEGWFANQTPEFAERVEKAILNIPAIFTNVNFVDEWVGELHAVFCPYVSLFNETSILQQYQEAAEELGGGKLWAYTCSGPIYPYPTFHIDDSILGMRVCGWMEKSYDVTGYLYYSVDKYTYSPERTEDNYVDVYETAARYDEVNGDGYLLYPGKYYGSDKPFASVRLASYRDGMDDYDMLCVYEGLLKEYAAKNNIVDFDFDDYVADLYDSLFKGAVAESDDALIFQARKELANRILTLKNNGEPVANEKEQIVLTDFASDIKDVKVSGDSTLTSDAKGTVQVTMKAESKDKGDEIGSKTKLFRPYLSLAVSDFASADTLYFTYENTGEEDISMQITLVTESGEKEIVGTSFCGAGKTRDVRVHFYDDMEIELSKVSEIRLTFDNVGTDENGKTTLLPDKMFNLSDFRIDVK